MMFKTIKLDPVDLFRLAYDRGAKPKWFMHGPLFDLSVVGLFFVVAIGYALT